MRLLKRNPRIWHDLNEKIYDDETRWREERELEEKYKEQKAKEQTEKYKKELIGFMKENGAYDTANSLNNKWRKVYIDIVSSYKGFSVRIYVQYCHMHDRIELYRKYYDFYNNPVDGLEEMFFTTERTAYEVLSTLREFKRNCVKE